MPAESDSMVPEHQNAELSFSTRRAMLGAEAGQEINGEQMEDIISRYRVLIDEVLASLQRAAANGSRDEAMSLATYVVGDPWVKKYAPQVANRVSAIIRSLQTEEPPQEPEAQPVPTSQKIFRKQQRKGPVRVHQMVSREKPLSVITLRPVTPVTASLVESIYKPAKITCPFGACSLEELSALLSDKEKPLDVLRTAVEQERMDAEFAKSVARELWYHNAVWFHEMKDFCATY